MTLVCFGETPELNTCKKTLPQNWCSEHAASGGDSPRQADQILQAKPP